MARVEKTKGLSTVLKNIRAVKKEHAAAVERGLVKAGLFLQRASQKIVPVDTGALKNSAFTRKEGEGLKTKVRVGYTKEYAIYVHENLEARHRPGKTAKYLERPARQLRKQMLEIVSKEIEKATKKRAGAGVKKARKGTPKSRARRGR